MPHDPSNNNCPRNADPRNESCTCIQATSTLEPITKLTTSQIIILRCMADEKLRAIRQSGLNVYVSTDDLHGILRITRAELEARNEWED